MLHVALSTRDEQRMAQLYMPAHSQYDRLSHTVLFAWKFQHWLTQDGVAPPMYMQPAVLQEVALPESDAQSHKQLPDSHLQCGKRTHADDE